MTKQPPRSTTMPSRRKRGFERASSLLQTRIRNTSATRGFAESRLLTHWAEIVGDETASMAVPVKISYGRGGFGATLTVLTTGAQAPMLQAELPKIVERVNVCYGYAAISRIHITQTAPTGFSEGRVNFEGAKKRQPKPIDEDTKAAARELSAGANDPDLRAALETLAQNVLSRTK